MKVEINWFIYLIHEIITVDKKFYYALLLFSSHFNPLIKSKFKNGC